MAVSKSHAIELALTKLFGVGYSLRADVVHDEVFPDIVKHFDVKGLQFLKKEQRIIDVSVDNTHFANVPVTFAVCPACNKIFYKVGAEFDIVDVRSNHNQQAMGNGFERY